MQLCATMLHAQREYNASGPNVDVAFDIQFGAH
jgi:hypothetical protein